MQPIIIDVRERNEFNAEHIANSINLPLSDFAASSPAILKLVQNKQIIIMCHSGNRAQQAVEMLNRMGVQMGNAIRSLGKTPLPLMRRVQLAIGTLITIFALFSIFWHPGFIFAVIAMGSGLFFAGASGSCMLANTIAKMPWNRVPQKLAQQKI